MKQKQSGCSIGGSHNQNFRKRGLTRRETSDQDFEQRLRDMSEPAKTLLRFARQRGIV